MKGRYCEKPAPAKGKAIATNKQDKGTKLWRQNGNCIGHSGVEMDNVDPASHISYDTL